MADFYPLLDRAIRGLPDNTPEARNALFARARDVLLAQLRGMDPPLPEADIAHEMAALDDVIARIEREQGAEGAGGQPSAAAAPSTLAPSAAPSTSQSSASQGPASRSPAPQAPAPQAPRPQASGSQAGGASPDSAPVTGDSSAPAAPRPASQLGHTGIRPANGAPQAGAGAGREPASAGGARASGSAPDGAPAVDETRLRPPQQKPAGKGRRNVLIGALLVVALAGVGGVAYWANKVKQPTPQPTEAPVAAAPDAGGDQKFGQRVDAGRAPAGQQGGAAQQGQTAEGVQRAILYEETPDNPQTPKVYQGTVTWRLDSENPGQNQPLENVVRADVTIPEAGLDLKITLRRNTDAALPASHLMELTFRKGATGDGRVIRDVGVPQFKTEENARGVPLAGLPVAVSESVFLVGLSNLPNDVERNVDLIRNRPWIDLPVRYDNGRRAVIALEKGATGDKVIAEAFKSWGAAN